MLVFFLIPLLIALNLSSTSAFHGVGITSLRLQSPSSSLRLNSTPSTKTKVESYEELDPDEDAQLIERVSREVLAESGVELDQLINPAKVVNLERDIAMLEKQRALTSSSSDLAEIEEAITSKRSVIVSEKRLVMRGWLKGLFVGQSVAAIVISLGLVYNAIPYYDADLSIRVLGLWSWWLFIVPSLRYVTVIVLLKYSLDKRIILSTGHANPVMKRKTP